MKVLIKKATLHHADREDDGKKDVLIEDGRITRIAKSISDGTAEIIESADLHVSPGWIDIGAQAGQPGYEYRETFQSLAKTARAGGFTHLATFPRNNPPIQSRIEIEFVQQIQSGLPVRLYPIGAISQDLAGKDLTEMLDMINAGAIAFTDGRKGQVETGLLTRALEYVLPFRTVIIDFPLDRSFTTEGHMHEGNVSASLGLTGIPSIAEEIIVQRDLQLLAYTKSRLHLHAISTAATTQYLSKARNEGLNITADVSAMHLYFEDKNVGDFDSYKKVLPPFRSQKDRKALIKALQNGVIDHISSIHSPLEPEAKECEFTYASFGSIGLETSFAAAHTILKDHMDLDDILHKFIGGPASIFGITPGEIKKDALADLTLFDPGQQWEHEGSKYSLSKNDAFLGASFTGRVVGTVSKGHLMIN